MPLPVFSFRTHAFAEAIFSVLCEESETTKLEVLGLCVQKLFRGERNLEDLIAKYSTLKQ